MVECGVVLESFFSCRFTFYDEMFHCSAREHKMISASRGSFLFRFGDFLNVFVGYQFTGITMLLL